ncbi:hypothetical protein LA080_013103 [Diaporthe eres]|nr:hypothetical protein LA080_013103 [Diaporthe eres]
MEKLPFSSARESSPGRESTDDDRFSTTSHESGSSVADDLHRNTRCAKMKHTFEDSCAVEAEDGDYCKRRQLQKASDQVQDTATPSLSSNFLPTPPPAHSSLSSPEQPSLETSSRIEKALFCTTKSILGVVTGGSIDADCPNRHGHQHPSATDSRQALHDQLTQYASDMHFLWMGFSGSTGTLFIVRLASLGYVILAKSGTCTARGALRTRGISMTNICVLLRRLAWSRHALVSWTYLAHR